MSSLAERAKRISAAGLQTRMSPRVATATIPSADASTMARFGPAWDRVAWVCSASGRGRVREMGTGRRREQRCDLARAQHRTQRDEEIEQGSWCGDALERGQRLDDHPRGCEVGNVSPEPDEVVLQRGHLGILGHDLE